MGTACLMQSLFAWTFLPPLRASRDSRVLWLRALLLPLCAPQWDAPSEEMMLGVGPSVWVRCHGGTWAPGVPFLCGKAQCHGGTWAPGLLFLCRKTQCGQSWRVSAGWERVGTHAAKPYFFLRRGEQYPADADSISCWSVVDPVAPPRWRMQTHKLLCLPQVCFYHLQGHLMDFLEVSSGVAVTTPGHLFKSPKQVRI